MSEDRPIERGRAKRGLGARSPQGETTRATPEGRLGHLGNPGAEGRGGSKKARGPRAENAKRRTARDNPGF